MVVEIAVTLGAFSIRLITFAISGFLTSAIPIDSKVGMARIPEHSIAQRQLVALPPSKIPMLSRKLLSGAFPLLRRPLSQLSYGLQNAHGSLFFVFYPLDIVMPVVASAPRIEFISLTFLSYITSDVCYYRYSSLAHSSTCTLTDDIWIFSSNVEGISSSIHVKVPRCT